MSARIIKDWSGIVDSDELKEVPSPSSDCSVEYYGAIFLLSKPNEVQSVKNFIHKNTICCFGKPRIIFVV